MNSVHFASLFGVDCDMDLAYHWIEHYRAYHFNSYSVWLHSASGNTSNIATAKRLFTAKGFLVTIVKGKFRDGGLRQTCLENFRESLDPTDYLVTADSDEFHDMPWDYALYIREYDIVFGRLVDRYDHTLHAARPDELLSYQFPFSGDVEGEIIKTVSPRYAANWPRVKKDKIMASRADIRVAFGGSHQLESEPVRELHYTKVNRVFHYSWRDSIIERMAGKNYFHAAHVWYVHDFFGGGELPRSLTDLIAKEESEQIYKGWVPCN